MNESPKEGLVQLSVVIPVYGARECLAMLHQRLVLALEPLVSSFEILMVNDASPDGSWEVIEELAARDPRVRGLDLSRNFGQHQAIAAGIDHARGEWAVVMDCDLQHPPEEIKKLYRKAMEGHDIVLGRRSRRKDGVLKRTGSKLFVGLLGYLTGVRVASSLSNFSIVSRPVIRALQSMREQSRSYPILLGWLGFELAFVDYEHAPRFTGSTSYTFPRLLRFAVESIVSRSNKPLWISIWLGLLLAAGAILYGGWLIFRNLRWDIPVPGWAGVVVLICFVGGLLFVNLGILGLYVGKIFEQSKGRPLYVLRRTVNLFPPNSARHK